jgi:arylsulfatase I/J
MRPHVLLMLADDWGSYDASHRIRSLGREPDVLTPEIDRLTAAGVQFENYYVQPICSPTRASLLSGRYSIHTGAEHRLWGSAEPSCLPVALPLLPRAFKALGYSTHMVGKHHLGYPNGTCAPWGRGFDSFLGFLNGNQGYYQHGIVGLLDFHQCDPASDACDGCTAEYGAMYSTEVYTSRAQALLRAWTPAAPPLFLYVAWQAVHEPMEVPAPYLAPFTAIADPSRRLYAGMLYALDEGIANITATLREQSMLNDTVVVLSNDNGGMSGSYGLGCCNCGTSCGGLNYPYRGWKDSYWEGGFRGIGFAFAPGRLPAGATYQPLLWVGDWYRTLLSAAVAGDAPAERRAADAALAPLLAAGPIDSVDQWAALVAAANATVAPPRTEIVLAGIDVDRQAAAIRVGDFKLVVGGWGEGKHCDLNVSGHSPAYPVAPVEGMGGEGGLYCMGLVDDEAAAAASWWDTFSLYDVVADPRELRDVKAAHPDVVARLRRRLLALNATTAPTAHADEDPAGTQHAEATGCFGPWT